MKSLITIYLNNKCNISCAYCFLDKNNDPFMDRQRLEKILRWYVEQEGREKHINFFAGEPLLSADVLVGVSGFLKRINSGKKIVIREIPTNGILLNPQMLKDLKQDGIKLTFSLDGAQFEHNRFRLKNRALFDKILKNIELYKEYCEVPGIKCTVHPAMAQDLDKRVLELIDKGFRDIQILPAFAFPWSQAQVEAFKESIENLTRFYLKLLKSGCRSIRIHPIERIVERLLNGEVYDEEGAMNCHLGSEPVFMPDGKAYACTMVMHYDSKLMEEFSIGHIDTGVDMKKMGSFLDYKMCDNEKSDCTGTTSKFCCRRIFDTKTRGLLSPEDIERMFEVDAFPFLSVKNALAQERKLEILQA